MDIKAITEIVSTVGFPIACCVCMAWFIFHIYKNMVEENEKNMEKVQARCKEREDRLYDEIAKNREVNSKALETIKLYAERLMHIENSVEHIQNDVIVIKDRLEK